MTNEDLEIIRRIDTLAMRLGLELGTHDALEVIEIYCKAQAQRLRHMTDALTAIAAEDELVQANPGAFGIHAFRRCQEIARVGLKQGEGK